MMQITHEQAQAYLQAAADQLLDSEKTTLLDSHLAGCDLCQAYAQGLSKLEDTLRNALRNRWNASPIPVSMRKILSWQNKSEKFTFQRVLQFAGAPVMVVAVIAITVLLGIRHFSSVLVTDTPLAAVSAVAIPTPSTQLTTSSASVANCDPLVYKVQTGDTLESIAQKFSVSKEKIMETNSLKSEELSVSAQLLIPQCVPTPSLTPTTTLTYTVTPFTVNASRTP